VIEESVLVRPDVKFFAQLRDDQKCLPTFNAKMKQLATANYKEIKILWNAGQVVSYKLHLAI
jgi:hypothetical protein